MDQKKICDSLYSEMDLQFDQSNINLKQKKATFQRGRFACLSDIYISGYTAECVNCFQYDRRSPAGIEKNNGDIF